MLLSFGALQGYAETSPKTMEKSSETETASISIYTVDFHHNGILFQIPGGTEILLSELFEELKIDKAVDQVENVTFSDETLVKVKKVEGDWKLVSLQAFFTEEKLTIYFKDQSLIEMKVTDDAYPNSGRFTNHNTANDAVQLEEAALIDTSVPYGNFAALSGVYSRWSVWKGGKHDVYVYLYDENWNPIDYSFMTSHPASGGWLTMSGNYWYEVTDYDYAWPDNDMTRRDRNTLSSGYCGALASRINWVEIQRFPLDVWDDGVYCNVDQVSKFALDESGETGNRTVVVYANGTEVGRVTKYFPTFEDISSSDLNVYPYSGWVHQKTDVSGSTYSVYLTSVHTITWKNGDGTVIETDKNVAYGATPSYNGGTPTKTSTAQYNYTWTGGWTPAVSTVTKDVTYTATFNSNLRYYAVTWKNYDGAVLETDASVAYGTTPTYDGATPTKPEDNEYTYRHSGWSPAVSAVTGNITYTAVFESVPKYFAATATAGDGVSSVSGGGSYRYNTDVTFMAAVKLGYEWDGWYNGSAKVSADQNYTFKMPASNVNYTAKAKIAEYTVTYDVKGGNTVSALKYKISDDVTLAANPGKTGYIFGGWKLNAAVNNWEAKTYAEKENVGTGKYGNITLEADWTPIKYKVEFSANGGAGEIPGMDFVYDKAQTLPATKEILSKEGHTFDGWNTAADGSGTSYADGASVSNLTAEDGKTVTLYAKWKANVHTATAVNGNEKGITEVTGSGDYEYGKNVTFSAAVKDGYTFEGWYEGENRVSKDTSYSFAMPDWDVTYTAKATANKDTKYTVYHMVKDYGSEEYRQYEEPVVMAGTTDEATKAESIEIPGYILAKEIVQTTISGKGDTIVEIFYDETAVTVNYLSSDEKYGTLDNDSETVGAASGELQGAAPTAKEGFKFAGWYTDEEFTKAVDKKWVDETTGKLVPQKEKGLYADGNYYAKFEAVKSTVKVVVHVGGRYADQTLEFTGKVNYELYENSPDTAQAKDYALKDKLISADSMSFEVNAGKKVWLTEVMQSDMYTLEKVVFSNKDSSYEVTNVTDTTVEHDQFVLQEGENEIHLYYQAKDVPGTGVYGGHTGSVVAVIAVAAVMIVIAAGGKKRRRNEA